ncbi:uncharacterized protein LOC128268054 [Anopheles cruzii]|uniref:uncharacterized protein LOC128268054 n=1 Tax=Anopheles cruzii TaxID=68878 RepID=UPI0022EC1DD9|nr:uncharacterized protein LOC128268054 [Anopheles cruzii]
MNRVWLVQPDGGWELVLNTRRSYRNIYHKNVLRIEGPFERLSWFLQTLKFPVRRLKIDYRITFEELRLILLEVPELQYLSIESYIDFNCKTNEPLPVLTKLKCLELGLFQSNLFDCFRMNVANLQSLYMSCETDGELETWRHLSGQLKLVHVFFSTYSSQFLELTFPHLEDFTIEEVVYGTTEEEEIDLSRGNDFFRRHSLLRRLSVPVPISVEWIRSITSHCPELTYLSLVLKNPEEGTLESLVQLTKLRHLSFPYRSMSKYNTRLNTRQYTQLDEKLFRGTFKSLESVELQMHPTRILLENLFETAPQLKYLKIMPRSHYNLQLDIQFICEKFSCLRRLELNMYKKTAADNSVRIDRLDHLEELKIRNVESISFIHRNNVRCLTLSGPKMNYKDLDQIPEKFPLLKRLILDSFGVSLANVKRLHKLMPSCRIDFGSHRFYPQVLP